MQKTYTAAGIGVTFGSNKSLLGIFNAHATRKVRVYRVWLLNNQTTAVTGVLTSISLRRVSAFSGGTAVTPAAHDTANTSADLTNITCATGATFTNTADNPFRVVMWSGDEPAVATATSDELECIVPLMCIWDSTGDENIEPLVANQNQGYHVLQPGANTVGVLDIFIEFTVA